MKIQNIYDDEMVYSVQLLLVVFREWYSWFRYYYKCL